MIKAIYRKLSLEMGHKKLLQFGEISFHVHGKAKPVIRPLDDHQTLMLRAAGAVVLLTHVTRNVTVRVTMEKDNGQAALAKGYRSPEGSFISSMTFLIISLADVYPQSARPFILRFVEEVQWANAVRPYEHCTVIPRRGELCSPTKTSR